MSGASYLHQRPKTKHDQARIRGAIFKQQKELVDQRRVWVTCPCGTRLVVHHACKCWFCGLFFCDKCCEIHFGPKARLGNDYLDGTAPEPNAQAACLVRNTTAGDYQGKELPESPPGLNEALHIASEAFKSE
jgi:hypothetical protein